MSIPTSQPLRQFVRAGAGAGKTWNLTREVIKQALDFHNTNGQWPKTVVTTFTRKATQELKERMLIYCLEEKPEALDYVQSSSFLNITTMHGLLNTFLSRMGIHMGLPGNFKIISSQKAKYWRMQILKNMMSEGIYSKELQVYDFNRIHKNLLDFESLYWQMQSSFLQEEDFKKLNLETLKNLADELSHLRDTVQDLTDGEKWDNYWQSINQLILLLQKPLPWNKHSTEILKLAEDFTIPRKNLKNNVGPPEEIKKILTDFIKDLKEYASDPQFSEEAWSKMSATYKEFNLFANEFMSRLLNQKLKEASLETSDLEFFSLNIIKKFPDAAKLYSENFDNWFIDEFQDTSPLQLKVLEPLIAEKSCYIVGDPQQSIYLFRGSRSEVFLKKEKEMELKKSQMHFLIKNYRSRKSLVDFINQLFPSIHKSFSAMEFTRDDENLLPATRIAHFSGDETRNEIFYIAKVIKEKISQGANLKDFCILSRTRSDSELIQKELMQLGFPVISHSSSEFYTRREVLDGFSLLQLILNPWDDKNLILFMRSPWMALTDQEILKIKAEHKNNYWSNFKKYFQDNPDYYPGQCILEALQLKTKLGVGWTFRKTLLKLGLIDHSFKVESTGRREANLWKIINLIEKATRESNSNLLQLIKEGVEVTNLEDISEGADASSPVEPNKINLMTIHASKGLQFKYVFIPFLDKKLRETNYADFCDDQIRNKWSMRVPVFKQEEFVGGLLEKYYVKEMKQREKEESLRLLYVAATRAEEELYLSWSHQPKKDSWAELIQSFIEKDNNNLFEYLEFENIEPSEFLLSKDKTEVKTAFLQPIKRFDMFSSELRAQNTYDNLNTWEKIESQQSKRWKGVVLHKVFENLKKHSMEQVSLLAESWLNENISDVKNALNYIQSNIDLPILKIIENGHVEWGYQRIEAGEIIERRIDLWGILNDELWIIDYKTGDIEYKDKALIQMREYKKALIEYLKWQKPVKMAAVYPFSQKSFLFHE
jgi:ATP-dependent helicase/nuclease subunit A